MYSKQNSATVCQTAWFHLLDIDFDQRPFPVKLLGLYTWINFVRKSTLQCIQLNQIFRNLVTKQRRSSDLNLTFNIRLNLDSSKTGIQIAYSLQCSLLYTFIDLIWSICSYFIIIDWPNKKISYTYADLALNDSQVYVCK